VTGFLKLQMSDSEVEAGFVREAFSVGSFVSIKDLPDRTRPGEVAFQKELKKLGKQIKKGKTAPKRNLNGLFSGFEYRSSPYSLEKESERKRRSENKMKILSKRKFIVQAAGGKSKFEDPFSVRWKPFPYQSNEFEALQEKARDEVKNHRNKILHGAFHPSGRSARTGTNSKENLERMKAVMEKILRNDWKECELDVTIEDKNKILVRFDIVSLEGQVKGLRAFMNNLEFANEEIKSLKLSRCGQIWSKIFEGNLFFQFQVPR